ncbi:hypothetical protein SLEP1_g5652 [Rubroshorea leprosula]|uniref:3-ketoacyl-CoA synthase n=1 Tax=Rubroshorea leprosula TaxID=152421 RepID=A0AAV5HSN7_9ROSI|nr:hypothetical protein SLEP1_g5652 [Rubroshorea leprosula]
MELFMTIFLLVLFCFMSYLCKMYLQMRDQCCYMLAYECYKPGEDRKLGTDTCAKVLMRNKNLGLPEYKFLLRTMANSGIGEETYGPKNVIAGREASPNLADALSEVDDIMFNTLDKLFARTGVSPSEIDILVVNVSLFSPAPSLTARIINRYKMRDNIKAVNLAGEGCSASMVAIDLVQQMFKTYKNAYAIVVSTESIGPNWYNGQDKSMMLSNLLFRSGGCSTLLTNKAALSHQALMKLNCSVRTHIGSDDEAYGCCIQIEDKRGYPGFLLTRKLPKSGAKAFILNLQVLLPKVLPLRELLQSVIKASLSKKKTKSSALEAMAAGLNLKSGIEHFCIHPGGKAVIDELGKSLGLSEYDVEPSRMALHRFGNTSSGGLWYTLGYMEAKKRLKKGDRIFMISLGAGFMCNNCVWEVTRDLEDPNVWKDCLENYPVKSTLNPFMDKYNWINDESIDINSIDQEWLENKLGFQFDPEIIERIRS